MTKQLSIARDGVCVLVCLDVDSWERPDDGSIENDQDREIYDAIETAIREGEASLELDGHIYTWRAC